MNKTKLSLLIISPFLLAACTHVPAVPAPESATTNQVPAPGSEGVDEMVVTGTDQTDSDIKQFTLTAKQWEWSPSTITVNQGDTVRLTITSTDVNHGLNIPGYKINKVFAAGESITVEFLADKAGEFPFSCSVACGKGHSDMTGTLIVQ